VRAIQDAVLRLDAGSCDAITRAGFNFRSAFRHLHARPWLRHRFPRPEGVWTVVRGLFDAKIVLLDNAALSGAHTASRRTVCGRTAPVVVTRGPWLIRFAIDETEHVFSFVAPGATNTQALHHF